MREDVQLYEDWRNGDKRAGLELFDRYYDGLWRFFHARVSTDVEDLVQETLLECLRSHGRLREATSFRAFVFAIARHRLFHRLRAQQRLHSFEGKLAAKPQTSQTSPSTIVRQQSAARQLVTMLRELPLELQLTLELFYWEKLSYEDVGYVLGIGREAVKSRLRRAKSLLQEKLADDAHPRAPTRPLQNWASAMRDALSTTRLERLHRRSEE